MAQAPPANVVRPVEGHWEPAGQSAQALLPVAGW
jgi:hypothetical protein